MHRDFATQPNTKRKMTKKTLMALLVATMMGATTLIAQDVMIEEDFSLVGLLHTHTKQEAPAVLTIPLRHLSAHRKWK